MPAPVLQFKRGNAGVAGTVPALRPGEPAISLNNFDLFVGFNTTVAGNRFFGSHRYWGREDGTTSLRLKLVDRTGVGGTIELKTPDSHTGVTTYTLPSTPVAGNFLKVDANGNLSWDTVTASASFTNSTLTGVTTITGRLDNQANTTSSGIVTYTNTTDNTLGNSNTGAVQIDGGLGVDKNVTVGGNLNVQGQSEFVGIVTFRGGVINLGDNDGDNITVGGRFSSNLVPSQDNTYDVGISTLNWRNAHFSGIGTFETGAVIDAIQIGINGANVIDTVSGNLTLNSASGTTIIDDAVTIQNNLTVNGSVTVGGTTVTLRGQDVFIENKDIILGYTTSVTPNDDTANHAGVAIASTIGSPLVSFSASGINTLPDTYKQLMWFKSGTLGFGTDAFAFNYGVAIGTTTMANGVRLAVGSGITMTDNAISATTVTATTGNFTNLSGSITGTISTATRATTVDTTGTTANADYFVPFVDGPISGQNGETLRVGIGLSVNPSNGNVGVTSILSVGNVNAINAYIRAGGGSNAMYLQSNGDVAFQAKVVANNYRSSSNSSDTLTFTDLDAAFARNLSVAGVATVTGNLSVNGGTVTTTGTAATVFNTNATTVNAFGAATSLNFGATTGTATINNPTVVGTQATQNLYNSVATNLNFGGAATALVMGATSGIATINNATLTLPNATTVNVNGASPTFASSSTGTLTFFNNNIASVNEYGAATALVVGATTGIATIRNATFSLPNATTVNVNGASPTFASSSTGTLTFFNTNITSVNEYGAASNITIGANAGITTFNGSVRITNFLRDSSNSAGSSGQFLVVTGAGIGWTTISGVSAGTISTATRAQTIDSVTSGNTGTYFPALFASSTPGTGVTAYVDSGISFDASADTLTLTGDIAVNGGDVTTTATTFNLINGTATNVNFAGAATALVLANTTGITTVRNKLTVSGNLEVDGNNIQASDGNTNITLTSNTLTTFAGDIRVNGNDIQSSTGANAITLSGSDVSVVGDLTVTGNDIKSSTGTPLTLSGNDVTVNGNLYVSGSTTQVNTGALTVEDRTIDLGIVNGATPSSATTWDLGVLFNYHSGGSAKKSAVIWEHADSRFKFASVLSADTDGTDNNSPQLTVTTYSPIEVSSLWINGCGSLGALEVIKCDTTQILLQDITVDAGTF